MSGEVFETAIRSPSSSGSPWPGSTSMNMSLRPVFGRSSAVASSVMRFLYSLSMSASTTATPSSTSTVAMSPTLTPATRTVWPWPGITARASAISISMRFGFSSISGKLSRCCSRM